jgi:hypothetical protein
MSLVQITTLPQNNDYMTAKNKNLYVRILLQNDSSYSQGVQ